MEPAVAYACKAASHQQGEDGPDKLTVHAGQWAFCPFGVKADGHQWMDTGGLPLSTLRQNATTRARERVSAAGGGK